MTHLTLDKLPRSVLAKIDIQTAFTASQCVLAAERVELFRKLSGKKLTAAAIGRKTGIRSWRLAPYLSALVSLGLLKREGKLYKNSALAEKYYVRDRSIHWTRIYSKECQREYQAFSVLEQMLITGRDFESILGIKREGYVELMKKDPRWAHDFTHMLYYDHLPVARALAKALDLTEHHRVLDVGGGSGVVSIALVRRYKHIKACVLDIEAVIKVTKKLIRRERLARRIDTCVGDMTKNIPSGYDVILFCDAESPLDVLGMTHDSLPPDGMVAIAEDFSTEDLTEPFYRLMWQLRSKRMWLPTVGRAKERLRASGFRSIKPRRIYGDFWLITGRKGR
ncbi:MAG: methyltransferase [Candidatus Zixiibacteriota bacterium]|nr:MAG: methyltransferase [candidate division Zixibacteria bacterium]